MPVPPRYAVLIGVDHTANLPALHGPSNDVAAWSTFLKKLNFDESNVKTLTNEQATTANVQAALATLLSKLDGPEALGFVFFAGHGDLSMDAWTTAFLADYAGQTDLGGGGRQIADAGCLHVNRLRLHAADNAFNPRSAEATLVVVLDACRVTPEGLGAVRAPDRQSVAAEWTGNQVLITATRPDELSYERHFFGTARGQLSWALLTVLEEWWVGEPRGAAYIQASYAEVVARTSTMIGAVSAEHQPQHPQVVGGTAALGTAVLRAVGRGPGVIHPGPRPAPGHEWGPGTDGIISVGSTEIGRLFVTPQSVLEVQWTNSSAPAAPGANLRFRATPTDPPPPAISPTVYANPSAWTLVTGGTPSVTNASENRKIGLTILPATADQPYQWNWFAWVLKKADGSWTPPVFPINFDMPAATTMPAAPSLPPNAPPGSSMVLATINDSFAPWDP